jgi:hypothetical protein
LTPTELRRLLRQRERAKVDFKRELSTRSKDEKAAFVKDVIALTNTPGGDGRLIVGVDDETGQVVPGHHVDTIEALDRVISQYVRPPIRIDPEVVTLDGVPVTVLALRRQARDLPYSVRKAVGGNTRELRLDEWWVRHGRTNAWPTMEEQAALWEERFRARRSGGSAARRAEPDEFGRLTVIEQAEALRSAVTHACRSHGLRPVMGRVATSPMDDVLQLTLRPAQTTHLVLDVEQFGHLFTGTLAGSPILLSFEYFQTLGAKHAEYWRRHRELIHLRRLVRGPTPVPLRFILVTGSVGESVIVRTTSSVDMNGTAFSTPAGLYVGPSLDRLGDSQWRSDDPPPKTHDVLMTLAASQWVERMGWGHLGYAPTLCVSHIRSAAIVHRAVDDGLSWFAEHVPLESAQALMKAIDELATDRAKAHEREERARDRERTARLKHIRASVGRR